MKDQYLYALLDADGKCRRIESQGTVKAALVDLVADGWRPLRETPFAPAVGSAYMLLVLEREAEGKLGFGFNPG